MLKYTFPLIRVLKKTIFAMVGKCSNLITRPTSSGSLAIVQCLMRDFPEDSGIFHIRIVNTTSQRYWDFLFIYFHDNWSQDRLTTLATGNFLLAIVNDPWMITSGVEIIFIPVILATLPRFPLLSVSSWQSWVLWLVLQKVASEGYPKVRNHGEGPY